MMRFIAVVVALGARLAHCAVDFNGPSPVTYSRINSAQQPDCPVICNDYTNVNSWTSFTSVERLQRCEQPMLIQLSLASPLDDPKSSQLIRSCTIEKQQSEAQMSLQSVSNPKKDGILFEPGLETAPACLAPGVEVTRDASVSVEGNDKIKSIELNKILDGMQKFFEAKDNCDESVVFGYYKKTVASVYVGSRYGKASASSIISTIKSSGGRIAQVCGSERSDALGVFIDGSGNLAAAQKAAITWNTGKCVQDEGRSNGKSLQKVKTWEIPNQNENASKSTSRKPSMRIAKSDGTCATHLIVSGDVCFNLAKTYGISTTDIENFNKGKTWAWNGCSGMIPGQFMCVSEGAPPLPAADANAICGPQKPGTTAPTDPSTSIANLNPCPLNACCSIHGYCGILPEFCEVHAPPGGGPGTKLPGFRSTCISNCGSDIKKNGDPPSAFQRIGYYQSSNLGRPCLTRKAKDANTDGSYTHIYWAFLDIEATTLKPVVVDKYQQWTDFKNLKNVKRIISFGGAEYSNNAATKEIIRNAVASTGRGTFINNIAQFLNDEGLDGVDIDWEYPASPQEGQQFSNFLQSLKKTVGTKSVSIAVPASYYYLQNYPIAGIARFIDYIVLMSYDLHGQWDYGRPDNFDSCPSGKCIRSHVNITETRWALSTLTKATVPNSKIFVGEASYGRSFHMASSDCWGPTCQFTDELGKPGRCTAEGGILALAEINEIIAGNTRVRSFYDADSGSDVVLYDGDYVAYMSNATKLARRSEWKGLNFGGSIDWAVDLQ